MAPEKFNNYKPTDFDSIGEEPVQPAEMTVEAPAAVESAAETTKAESVLSRGEARFQKVGATLNSLKDGMRNFFGRIPQVGRAMAVGVLSTPEIVGAGVESAKEAGTAFGSAVMERSEEAAKAALSGYNALGEKVQGGLDKVGDFVLDTPEKVAAFGREKGAQFNSFVAEKADAARDVAELAGNFTKEKAAQAREHIDGGIRAVTGWGERSLAHAEAKRQEAIQNFRSKMDQARVARLEREHQVTAEKLADIRSKLGLRDLFAASSEQPLAMAA